MAFQPFGYRFDIRAPMRAQEVRDSIKARLKGWFEGTEGARGWIAGSIFCLWSSALNRNGPMVIGRILEDGFATRIRGRAGSDLNGTMWMLILAVLFLVILMPTLKSGEIFEDELILHGGLFAVMVPVVLWFSHADRHEADHLVRFIEDVVSPQARSRREASKSIVLAKRFEMNVSGEKCSKSVTGHAIYEAMLATGVGGFIILASSEQTYIQALAKELGLIIEKREGSADQHFRAVRRGTGGNVPADEATHFSFEETWEVLGTYVSDAPLPEFLEWVRMANGTDVYDPKGEANAPARTGENLP